MKRQILIVALMLLLAVGLASAVVTTPVGFEDCTKVEQQCINPHQHCHWGHCHDDCDGWEDVCKEWVDNSIDIPENPNADTVDGQHYSDIQGYVDTAVGDEADERVAADNELQDNIDSEEAARIRNDRILYNGYTTADDELEEDLNDEERARRWGDTMLHWELNAEKYARWQADRALDHQIDGVEDTIDENSEAWSRDTSGISSNALVHFIFGNPHTLDWSDIYGTPGGYTKYLLGIVDEKIAYNNDYMLAVIQFGVDGSDFNIEHQAARNTAKRTGRLIITSDGYQCDAKVCVLWFITPEQLTQASLPVSDFHEAAMRAKNATCTESLPYYQNLCNTTGMMKWCNIASNMQKGCPESTNSLTGQIDWSN